MPPHCFDIEGRPPLYSLAGICYGSLWCRRSACRLPRLPSTAYLSMIVFNREQTREIDRRAAADYGMSGLVLMENAGRGVADKLSQWGAKGPVVVCCGKGNNGGDGFVLARHLDLRGISVRVLLWAEPRELSGDAAVNYSIIAKSGLPIEVFGRRHDSEKLAAQLFDAEWVVDALLGTGSRGEPRPPLGEVIEQLNHARAPKVAIDIPSGLDCDTGAAAAATVRARHTCTFVAMKPGFFEPGVAAYTGQVHVLDIGAPRRLLEEVATTIS
jgi:NAD(P)H-hydrate epimerase